MGQGNIAVQVSQGCAERLYSFLKYFLKVEFSKFPDFSLAPVWKGGGGDLLVILFSLVGILVPYFVVGNGASDPVSILDLWMGDRPTNSWLLLLAFISLCGMQAELRDSCVVTPGAARGQLRLVQTSGTPAHFVTI